DITCTINNNDIAPKLTLKKTVTNDNGGTALNTAWTLTATGALNNPTNLSSTTPDASATSFKPDTNTPAEINDPAGYAAGSWSCVKNNGEPVTVSLLAALPISDITCTINNNDIAPKLTLVKNLTNDNGGTAIVNAFTLSANGASNNPTGL